MKVELYYSSDETVLIGKLVKSLRKSKKMTQTQLGEKIGVQKAQISKIEKDTNNITLNTLGKVLKVFGAKLTIETE